MPISVIKFATASSSLLAAGDEAGQVRIIQLGSECSEVVQVRLPCQRARSPAYDVPARFLEAHSSSAPPSQCPHSSPTPPPPLLFFTDPGAQRRSS